MLLGDKSGLAARGLNSMTRENSLPSAIGKALQTSERNAVTARLRATCQTPTHICRHHNQLLHDRI